MCLRVKGSREPQWELLSTSGRTRAGAEPPMNRPVTRILPGMLRPLREEPRITSITAGLARCSSSWTRGIMGRANQRWASAAKMLNSGDLPEINNSTVVEKKKSTADVTESQLLPFGQQVAELFHRAETTNWNRNQNLSRLAGFPAHSYRCARVF